MHNVGCDTRTHTVMAHPALEVAETAYVNLDVRRRCRQPEIGGDGARLEFGNGDQSVIQPSVLPRGVVPGPHADSDIHLLGIALRTPGHLPAINHLASNVAHFVGIPDLIKGMRAQSQRRPVLRDVVSVSATHCPVALDRVGDAVIVIVEVDIVGQAVAIVVGEGVGVIGTPAVGSGLACIT